MSSDKDDDLLIVQRVQAGDKLAFNLLVNKYHRRVARLLTRMVRNQEDIEDIVQETFIKWLSQEQEKIRNTKAYLIRSVTNNCINHLNSLRAKRVDYLESFQWPEFVEKYGI